MPTQTLTFSYEETALADLDPERAAVCAAARAATALAYAPYSRFEVGCAAQVEGEADLVRAANLENAAYPQCICAEASLLGGGGGGGPRSTRAFPIALSSAWPWP